MKIKKIFYYLISILGIITIKLNENNFKYLFEEINIVYFASVISSNLYKNDISVSSTNIEVIDYYNINESLYVTPINEEVIIPISGIISKIDNNKIYLSSIDGIIIIENVNNIKYRLYTYYNAYEVLGYSKQYIIRKNIELVKNNYQINYEKI